MRGRGLAMVGLVAVGVVIGGAAGWPEAEAQVDADVVNWAAKTGVLTGMTQETLEDLVAANEAVLATNGSERALAAAYAETGVFEAIYSAALDIEPPPLVEPAHEELLMGFQLLAESAPVARRGLLFMDPQTIGEATALVEEANEHIRTATDLLNAALE